MELKTQTLYLWLSLLAYSSQIVPSNTRLSRFRFWGFVRKMREMLEEKVARRVSF